MKFKICEYCYKEFEATLTTRKRKFCGPKCRWQANKKRVSALTWELDWAHEKTNGSMVMARNPMSHMAKARDWHLINAASLRRYGDTYNIPTYQADSWEVDWSKRRGKNVWARNIHSQSIPAREWHWISYKTLSNQGIKWQPIRERTGRYFSGNGYVLLRRKALTTEQIALAQKYNLFKKHPSDKNYGYVLEHQLVLVQHRGPIPEGMIVRHLNGNKQDNRIENLVIGTAQENSMDHATAMRWMMHWHNRCDKLEAKIKEIEGRSK